MEAQLKHVLAIAPTSTTNGGTTTGNVDTLGYDHVSIALCATTSNAVTNKFSVCKLSQSDTTDATNFSDVTRFVSGTSAGNFTLANADTSSPYAVVFNASTRGLKRYLKITASPVTTQTIWANAVLSRGEAAPTSAAAAGANTLVEG